MYVNRHTRSLIDNLPPGVSVSSILREALSARAHCPHDELELRCAACGVKVGSPSSETQVSDVDIPPADGGDEMAV